MALSTGLTDDITELCTTLTVDPGGITDPLQVLTRDLRRLVPAFRGLRLVLRDHGPAITLASFEPSTTPDDIVSSLHLPLGFMSSRAEPTPGNTARLTLGSALTLYAAQVDAFVHLADEIAHILQPPSPSGSVVGAPELPHRPISDVLLDQHLMLTSVASGLFGAADRSTVDRAVGVLINQGHEPAAAERELTRRSKATGITELVWAARLLARTGGSGGATAEHRGGES